MAADLSAGTAQRVEDTWPVSVLLERGTLQHGPWSLPRWRLLAVLPGLPAEAAAPGPHLVHRAEDCSQYLWRGLVLRLHKDGAESYGYNVEGRQPMLFVVCQADAEGDLAPVLVSADYDEAGAHMEADDTVFCAPMPDEVRQGVQRYVTAYYRPQPRHKRRRADWKQESTGDQAKP